MTETPKPGFVLFGHVVHIKDDPVAVFAALGVMWVLGFFMGWLVFGLG